MSEFRVTFGQRFRHEHHPAFIAGQLDFEPDPDGWLTIVAEYESEARATAVALLGQAWAFLYRAPFDDDWDQMYPLGELAAAYRVTVERAT